MLQERKYLGLRVLLRIINFGLSTVSISDFDRNHIHIRGGMIFGNTLTHYHAACVPRCAPTRACAHTGAHVRTSYCLGFSSGEQGLCATWRKQVQKAFFLAEMSLSVLISLSEEYGVK